MNPQEAYKLIEQICVSVSLPRDGHLRVQKALDIIKKEIEKDKQTKSVKDDFNKK